MPPRTSQLLGLSPTEVPAGIFTALGEGGPGRDPLGVLATLLTRRQTGAYGKNLVDIAKARNQFVANDPYTAAQIANPAFGRKVYGKRYDELLNKFENPQNLIPVLKQHGGAVEFRGQTLLGNRRPGDVMFDPKGNFYFNKKPEAQKAILNKLSLGLPADTTQPQVGVASPPPGVLQTLSSALGFNPAAEEDDKLTLSQQFLNAAKNQVMQQMFSTNQFPFDLSNPLSISSFTGEV